MAMKKKIQDIILGKMEYDPPHLLLPENNLKFFVIEDEVYEGSFCIESSGEAIRGIVSCQNPNIACGKTTFDGQRAVIPFTYQADALSEGDTDTGTFVITSSSGEYLLPFQAEVTRHYLRTSIGKIKTLNDFANLAQINWEEARKVFQSPHFSNIFHEEHDFCALLYEGVTARSNGNHEMEEFLVGCGKKRRNQLTLETRETVFTVGRETVSDFFVLTKSEWGYVQARISVDAPFLRLEKKQIQMYDFVGKHAQIPFQIVPELMHGGKNYALITIENCFQKLKLPIIAFREQGERQKSEASELRKIRYEMELRYLDYRLGRTDADGWANEMLELLKKADEVELENRWNALFVAYVYLKTGKQEEAEHVIGKLPRNVKNQRSPLSAFYLYLTTFGENAAYVREVTVRVREIFLKHQNHPVLVWILLQIDEALLRNSERKYHMLKKYASEYSKSPIFYEEAAALVRENPALLHGEDRFDQRLIVWMAKRKLIDEAAALRILEMAQAKKQFQPLFYRVLTGCYKVLQSDEAIRSICTYLIKLNQYGEKYFPWFQRGIARHMKIAGLYEAYMMSWSKAEGMLPREVIKYFSMNSSLPAKRKALLFSYVVRNRERLGKDWDAYMVMVKNFAVKELEKGHMSEDLAVIYEAVKKLSDPGVWDTQKGKAEYCYRVHVAGENVTAIRVLQKGRREQQRVPVSQEDGYIYLYRRPFVILYEDAVGQIYAAKDNFRLRKMMSGEHIYAPEPKAESLKPGTILPTQQRDVQKLLTDLPGSISEMEQLILEAKEDGTDVLSAEEQLLIRMLFTGRFSAESDRLFQDISADEEASMVQDAYVSWFAYLSLTENQELTEAVSDYIGKTLKKRRLNGYCEIAWLKAFCDNNIAGEEEMAEQILQKYLFSGKYFDFYQKLPVSMKRKYLLSGTYVIQYVHRPGERLSVCVKSRKEELQEVLRGIYSMRVLFFEGDRVAYEIVDENGEWLDANVLSCEECEEDLRDTRYGKICAMPENRPDSRAQYAYAEQSDLTRELFLPIEE